MTAVDKKKVESKTLPAVPELRLKLAKKAARARAVLAKRRVTKTLTVQKRLRENFLRAEKYAKQYANAERREIEKKRSAKREGSYYIPGEARLAFVIRIRGWVWTFSFDGFICPVPCVWFSVVGFKSKNAVSLDNWEEIHDPVEYSFETSKCWNQLCAFQCVRWQSEVRIWYQHATTKIKHMYRVQVYCASEWCKRCRF